MPKMIYLPFNLLMRLDKVAGSSELVPREHIDLGFLSLGFRSTVYSKDQQVSVKHVPFHVHPLILQVTPTH